MLILFLKKIIIKFENNPTFPLNNKFIIFAKIIKLYNLIGF